MEYLILIVGLVLIIVGASLLTDGSVALAVRFRVPEFIVGLTVVAVGTSMPELAVSFFSALKGSGDMAIGNVVGSNICNTFLILGLCALLSPISFSRSNIRRDIPICIAASAALLIATLNNGDINRIEGLALLVAYVVMIVLTIRADRKAVKGEEVADTEGVMPMWRTAVWIIAGLVALIYGGQLCVDAATDIARSLGVSEATIAITLVAVGTSLPELAASLASIFKGRESLALGNVLGSNIANILLILGVCGTTTPLTMSGVAMSDICVAVATSLAIMLSALFIGHHKLTRFEGALFLAVYVVYIYTLI